MTSKTCKECRSLQGVDRKIANKLHKHRRWQALHSRCVKKPKYREYISSPRWAKKKEQLYKGRIKACKVCRNQGVEFHAHHLTYERLGSEPLSDFAVLCGACHAAVHSIYGKGAKSYPIIGMRRVVLRYFAVNKIDRVALRKSDPKGYLAEVAKCFRVYTHPFVQRCLK